MKVERSAGAVIFRREGGKILYLSLKYGAGHWDFPKGHIERGEKTLDTIRREVKEETGIQDLKFIEGFKKTIKYFFKWPPRLRRSVAKAMERRRQGFGGQAKSKKQEWRIKFVVFLLAKTKTKKVKISFEHHGFKWLAYEGAIKQLTFKTAKNVLKSANEFLQTKSFENRK